MGADQARRIEIEEKRQIYLKEKEEKRILEEKEMEEEEKRIAKIEAARERRLLALSEGRNLPVVSSQMILQKNEICHNECFAERYETKIVTTGREGGYRGVSIRIAKGISYHTGGAKSHAVKEEIELRHQGRLAITNKRVVFTGEKKNFTIPYSKLLGVNPYTNAFEFQTEKMNYIVLVEDTEYSGAILNGAIANYMNES